MVLAGLVELFLQVFTALVIILVHFHMVLVDGPVILILPKAKHKEGIKQEIFCCKALIRKNPAGIPLSHNY